MKTKKKVVLPLIIIGAVVVFFALFSVLTYGVNVSLMSNNTSPLFVFNTNMVNDGGTKIYTGLGYHIVEWSSFVENAHQDEDIEKALENSDLSREEYEELAKTNRVYVCGWDIAWGYDYDSTVKNRPGFEHTINLHFEFVKLN